jgi:hypothetical protein
MKSLLRAGSFRVLATLCLAASGLTVLLALTQGQASAGTATSDYAVLSSSGSNGLTPISDAAQASAASGPVVDAADPELDIGSIRQSQTSPDGVRLWVAQSKAGGICVLALKPDPTRAGPSGPASACTPSNLVGHGATLEQFGSAGETFVSGAVPNGVTNVVIGLENGSTETAAVNDNTYSAETSTAVATVSFESGGTQEKINLGGTR